MPNTMRKTEHELTIELLLQHVVEQLERLNNAIFNSTPAVTQRSTIGASDKRSEARSTPTLQVNPLAKAAPPRSAVQPRSVAPPRSAAPPTATSYSINAAPKQRITKQASNAPLAPFNPAVAKALKGSQYDFVPWFIREFCRLNAGRTITCRAISEVSAIQFGRYPATEIALAVVAKQFPDIFKIVKTSAYEDVTFAGNEIIIQNVDNPTNKRLSAVRIY